MKLTRVREQQIIATSSGIDQNSVRTYSRYENFVKMLRLRRCIAKQPNVKTNQNRSAMLRGRVPFWESIAFEITERCGRAAFRNRKRKQTAAPRQARTSSRAVANVAAIRKWAGSTGETYFRTTLSQNADVK
ncbi:hypothetical protein EVAR_99941_1 [Eumeta japonica]|uniref:Uncharacterized protein n=1 Tax=Eumeta variegata TaxID=151549 RepID=A0A4C1T2F0_EUMVA|nr:hypothetical protein EVAR_99941_1 [Eumeta japonica]